METPGKAIVEIIALNSGTIKEQFFKDNTEVTVGMNLYSIDTTNTIIETTEKKTIEKNPILNVINEKKKEELKPMEIKPKEINVIENRV